MHVLEKYSQQCCKKKSIDKATVQRWIQITKVQILIGSFYFLKDIYDAIGRICVLSLYIRNVKKQCSSSHQNNAHMVPPTVSKGLAFGTDLGSPKESHSYTVQE